MILVLVFGFGASGVPPVAGGHLARHAVLGEEAGKVAQKDAVTSTSRKAGMQNGLLWQWKTPRAGALAQGTSSGRSVPFLTPRGFDRGALAL
jgi:hypothetical protein